METLSNFPYREIEFDKQGAPVDGRQTQDLLNFIKSTEPGKPTDLLIACHGWNNDMNDARNLYKNFFGVVRGVLDRSAPAVVGARRFAVAGILWPSKKFVDADLIPGGAAAFNANSAVQNSLDHLKSFFDTPAASKKIDEAKALAVRLDQGEPVQDAWLAKLRELLPPRGQDPEDASNQFLHLPGSEILRKLQAPLLPPTAPGRSEGGAAGFGDFFGGIHDAALRVLNYATYYLMKDRAGMVGHTAVNDLIRSVHEAAPDLKIHLIGHSFGARVVTAAADGRPNQPVQHVSTMTLLQAAFSHYSFAHNYEPGSDGLFRTVVTEHKVTGPILITHSIKDIAVGRAYAIASRIAGQVAQGLGDENDRYGGLGRNGARITPEAVDGQLQPVGAVYTFAPGKIYNLTADNIIMEHSDICKPEVAYALLTATSTGSQKINFIAS